MLVRKSVMRSVISVILLFALAISLIGSVSPAQATDDEQVEQVKEFVERLYTYALDRPYDEQGLEDWTEALVSRRATGAIVAYGFFFSHELSVVRSVTDEEFVYRLYWALMNRPPDEQGREDWLARLAEGFPRQDIFAGFANSLEFTIVCERYGIERGFYTPPPGGAIRAFVTRLYTKALGRTAPDAEGLEAWTNALLRGATGAEVAYGFIFSTEMRNRGLTNEQFVNMLYQALLGRSPDGAAGDWVARLNEGYPREDIFAGFVNSDDFDRICREAGIVRGTYVPPAGGLIRVFVVRLFRDIIVGYNLTETELNFWHAAVREGRTSGAELAYEFLFSKDVRVDDTEFINRLFRALLRQEPTQAGINHNQSLIDNGVSRYTLFVNFANTAEFNNFCVSHGVVRGTAPQASNFMPYFRIWNQIRGANIEGVSDRPAHIAGMIGNMYHNYGPLGGQPNWQMPCPFQRIDGGLGILQWSGTRRTALESFMYSNGVLQRDFIAERNKCPDGSPCPRYFHDWQFSDRVLELQINFILHDIRNTERQYMYHINSPSNRTGIEGAMAYAELFCALYVRPPGTGIGEINRIRDPGVRDALRVSQFAGGPGHVDNNFSYSELDMRRRMAEQTFDEFTQWHR